MYTSYDEDSDITLYAQWRKTSSLGDDTTYTVTYPDHTVEVLAGKQYTLETNEYSKDSDSVATVTFVYNNGQGK